MREVRHLPPWMLQKAGAIHVKSDNVGRNDGRIEGVSAQVPELRANTRNGLNKKTRADHKGETSGKKLRSQVNCEFKRRRLLSKKDGRDGNIIQKGNKRDGSSRDRVQNSSVKESQNFEQLSISSDKCPVQLFRDEEMDLTVTDLMAIAEEYVNNYKQLLQEVPGAQGSSGKHNLKTSELGSFPDSPCKNKTSSEPAKEAPYSSTPTNTNDEISTNTCHAHDPAQDMLDLLLGPLLKKPLEEKKNEYVPEDLAFKYEVRRQSQGRVEEEMGPLEKKKGSLKHKVAMYLD